MRARKPGTLSVPLSAVLFLTMACSGGQDSVVMGGDSEEVDPKYRDAFRISNIEVTVATGIDDDGTIRVESLSKAVGDITTELSKEESLKQFDVAMAESKAGTASASASVSGQGTASATASSGGSTATATASTLSLADYPALTTSINAETNQPLPLAVITQNAPGADAQTFIADALPDGANSSADFTDCSKTATRTVAAFAKNFLGIKVAEVEYTLSYQYQCRYNGQGRYLANVRLFPSKVFVFWGFHLDFSIKKMLVTNVGTETGPVAQMQLHSHLSLRSPLSFETSDQVVSVNGKTGNVTSN